MAVTATYEVSIAWEAVPDYAFVLNASQLDSAKTLTSAYSGTVGLLEFGYSTFGGTDVFGGEFSGLFDSVTKDVKSISITRGRTANLDTMSAGEATIVLHDPAGKYNPLNASSPLAPYVVPGRAVRITASYIPAGGVQTTYPVYYGFVRSIEHNPSPTVKETRVMCQDLFMFLSRAKPIISNLSGTVTTGRAIGAVLDAIGWTVAAQRNLATGDTINITWPSADVTGDGNGTTTALDSIQKLLLTERGEFFQQADGVVRYADRYARAKRTSAATLTNVSAESAPATDLTTIVNKATVTQQVSSGAPGTKTYTDAVSVTNYGMLDSQAISSYYLNNADQCLQLATWLVLQQSSPSSPVRSLAYIANKTDALMVNALSRELGDRITVADSASGVTSQDFYVEGIKHDVSDGGLKHQVQFALSKVSSLAPIMFGNPLASYSAGATINASRLRSNGEFGSPTNMSSSADTSATLSNVFAY
jgi:hypothetical protein